MAETTDETGVPPHSKEAPIVENDVVQENGQLPVSENPIETAGKGREDPTLKSSAPTPEVTGFLAPPENVEEAKDGQTDTEEIAGTAPSADVLKNDEEVPQFEEAASEDNGGEHAILIETPTEHEKTDTEAIVDTAPSADAQKSEEEAPQFEETASEVNGVGEHALPNEASIEDGTTDTEAIAEKAASAAAPQAETDKELLTEKGVLESAEPHEETAGTEPAEEIPMTTEKALSEEIPVPVGEKGAEVEATAQSADSADPEPADWVAEEDTTNSVESAQTGEPTTELAEEVDSSKTGEPDTQVGEAEAPKSAVTEEREEVAVDERETHKLGEKADDTNEVATAASPRTEDVIETSQPNAGEVAAEEIPSTPDTAENNAVAPQPTTPSETDEPKTEESVGNEVFHDAVDSVDTEEPQAEVTSKDDSAADMGESISTEEKEVPKSIEDTTYKEVPTLALETGETEAETLGEEVTPKPEAKADDASAVAGKEIPQSVDVTETDQPNAAEDVADEIPKNSDITETAAIESRIIEDHAPKPSEVDECKGEEPKFTEDSVLEPSETDESKAEEVSVNEQQQDAVESAGAEEPRAGVTFKDEDCAADAGKPILTEAREAEEPKKVDEASHEELDTPKEQPPAEPEDPPKPKSFWGVVLKHVEPIVKLTPESQSKDEDSTGAPSSNYENPNDAHKYPVEAHEQEPVALPLADGAEQEIESGNAAASDVSPGKEGEAGVEEALQEETESQSTPKEGTQVALEEVSSPDEPSENATTKTLESAEKGTLDTTTPNETELATSVVEQKEIPPFETLEEMPESASEDTVPKVSETTAESADEPEEISTTATPEQEPVTAGQDTTEHLTQETPKESKPEEASLLVKEDAVEEKEAGDGGSAFEKQPSLSVFIPRQGEPAADTEGNTAEETTPRGTPLMQRVEHLEQKLVQLESRHSESSDFASARHSTPRSSIDRPLRHSARHVLEETGSKGTLLDRVSALEQKLSYYLNLHHTSPINGQSTPSIAEDLALEPELKVPESQTRDWSPSAALGEKTPEAVNEETSKAAQDPTKPTTDENSPGDLSAQKESVASFRSTSINEKKVKAKAAVGQIKGFITGCFSPKKGKPVSTSS